MTLSQRMLRAQLFEVTERIQSLEERFSVPIVWPISDLAEWHNLLRRREALEIELRTVLACG